MSGETYVPLSRMNFLSLSISGLLPPAANGLLILCHYSLKEIRFLQENI